MSVSQARAFTGSHLVDHRQPKLVEDVALVVSELATNVVAHAHTPFSVTIQAFKGSVLLLVSDDCPSVPTRATAAHLDTGGRGMMIVEALALDWGVTASADGTKSVWARFAWA